ncbi:hypothetical protein VTN96DRAFT_3238 [Rasamsonia emersonii]
MSTTITSTLTVQSADQQTAIPPVIELQAQSQPLSSTSTPGPMVLPSEANTQLDDLPPSERYPTWRKILILFTASWMTLAATFSSTSLLPAAPEIAAEFGTRAEVVSISNAGVLLAMGFASFIWGPLSTIIGRRHAYNLAIFIFLLFAIGAAVSKNFPTFVAMRTLAGFEASFFMVAGQAMIADIFKPATRGTAIGFFMSGTVCGPALGPCVGGVMVTFTTWRAIFWLQAAMAGGGLLLAVIFVPTVSRSVIAQGDTMTEKRVRSRFNPMRVIELLIYPNIVLTDVACGLLSWTMYSLLTSPRTLINPRFHLTSPLVSGLFYLAPGAGFLIGTTVGGKWADITVRRNIIKRNGVRIAQDRLNSGTVAFFILVPIATVIYGWCLQFTLGGLAVPIISIFFSGVGLMVAFSSLNTYCTEVMPGKRTEVMAGKYFIQYAFSAAGSATALPLINAIGVGAACTMSSAFAIVGGILVLLTAKKGSSMQQWIDQWKKTQGNRE